MNGLLCLVLMSSVVFNVYLMASKRKLMKDPLTGVYNRAKLNSRTTERIRNCGCVMYDGVGLREINKTISHKAGDDLLKEISCKLKLKYPNNLIIRWGGDEFLIIGTLRYYHIANTRFGIGFSIEEASKNMIKRRMGA